MTGLFISIEEHLVDDVDYATAKELRDIIQEDYYIVESKMNLIRDDLAR